MITADEHTRRYRVDSRWMTFSMIELHAGILALQQLRPFLERINNAIQLQFPVQRIRRCAQLIWSNASAAARSTSPPECGRKALLQCVRIVT